MTIMSILDIQRQAIKAAAKNKEETQKKQTKTSTKSADTSKINVLTNLAGTVTWLWTTPIQTAKYISKVQESKNITDTENDAIKQRVNDTYWMYSDTYKQAAYNDAYDAVSQRKAQVEYNQLKQRTRNEIAEKAAYEWEDLTRKAERNIAKAQLAISDAAEIIRQWIEANWERVDDSLTDKQLVSQFIEKNAEMPFAEYVTTFLNAQTTSNFSNQKNLYNNTWLASKLWLEWKASETLYNVRDKWLAAAKWFAQWLTNVTQNFIWAWAELLWAKVTWNDITWQQAKQLASSEDLWQRNVMSEQEWAYNVWEWLWEMASEIALTAPAESAVWWAVAASKAWKLAKLWANAWLKQKAAISLWALWKDMWTAAIWWLVFQALDDIAQWEWMSSAWQYAATSLFWAWSVWLLTAAWKAFWLIKKWWTKLLWASWQEETALLNQTKKSWAEKSSINETYAKDINKTSPREKIWEKLWWISNRIKAKWLSKWSEYSTELKNLKWDYSPTNVLESINNSLNKLENVEEMWNAALAKWRAPQFKITSNWELKIDNENLLNKIVDKDGNSVLKAIKDIRDSKFVEWWQKYNITTAKEFISSVQDVLRWTEWKSGKETIKYIIDWLDESEKAFFNIAWEWFRWTTDSFIEAKEMNNALETLLWKLDKYWTSPNAEKIWAASLWKNALWKDITVEELFKWIKEKENIDMNNEVLAWALNMSLYDVNKASSLLDTFYPSKPWVTMAILKTITNPLRKIVIWNQLERWVKISEMWNMNPIWDTIANKISNVATTNLWE